MIYEDSFQLRKEKEKLDDVFTSLQEILRTRAATPRRQVNELKPYISPFIRP